VHGRATLVQAVPPELTAWRRTGEMRTGTPITLNNANHQTRVWPYEVQEDGKKVQTAQLAYIGIIFT
jgi:hypothetical protein